MSIIVGVVDYGAGNLFSVESALKKVGCKYLVSENIDELRTADRIIFPGVGSFNEGMSSVVSLGLDEFIIDAVNEGKPLLGICLGMQLLLSQGDEGGVTKGIGILSGEVKSLDITSKEKVPHIGWNEVYGDGYEDIQLLSGVRPHSDFYFVHSYHVKLKRDDNPGVNILNTDFYGRDIVAGYQKDNVVGLQFHPEKSQTVGMRLLKNFLKA